MPRLSLYRPEKGNNFKFIDNAVFRQFQMGGTDVMVHKYLGPVDPAEGEATPSTPTNTNPIGELGIQDLIFMENRDRHYEPDVYQLRGIYTMQDIDFNLSQFGLFLTNDNIMITFHLRSTHEALGRKLMAGDVLELPHLKDEYALDDAMVALKRYYVVTDVTRPASGYSVTWYPHLLRCKCQPLVDSQEFKEILDADAGAGNGTSLRDLMSTYNKSIEINNAILAQAEADNPSSGYDTTSFYVIPTKENGTVDVLDTTADDIDATTDNPAADATAVLRSPDRDIYVGYLTGDGVPPNGAPYTFDVIFPSKPVVGQYHLRTDYFPNRLFRWSGTSWVKFEDNVRMTMDNNTKVTEKTSFINNNTTATIAGKVVKEKQALSKALRPQADN